MHDDIDHTTTIAFSGTTASAGPATAMPEHLPGLHRQWYQDTPSGGLGLSRDLMDTTEVQSNGARAISPSFETLQDQEDAWTEDMWDEYFGGPM